MKSRATVGLVLVGLLAMAGTAFPADLVGAAVETVAVGAVVSAVANPANDGINRLVGAGGAPGTATKVVPVVSVGEKGYVGAAQVAGSAALVKQTKAVLQFEQTFDNKQYRIKLLMPINSTNPLNAKRVRGVGVSGLLDVAMSHNAYLVPASERWNAGDVLKAAAIGVAATQFGSQINQFINTVFRNEGGLPDGATKVVPYLSVGTKAYIGMMQVAGPKARVDKVKAVWQYDQLFDRGRVRLRALVPADSINPLKIKRVPGVGCSAVIDAVALRAKEAQRRPGDYRYFERSALFVGLAEDPRYRPPGWDRGRKEGWIKHGSPNMPPGLAGKAGPPATIIVGEGRGEQARERLRHREGSQGGPPPGRGRRGRGN